MENSLKDLKEKKRQTLLKRLAEIREKQNAELLTWGQAENIVLHKTHVSEQGFIQSLTATIDGEERKYALVGDSVIEKFLENYDPETKTGLLPIAGVSKKYFRPADEENPTYWAYLP